MCDFGILYAMRPTNDEKLEVSNYQSYWFAWGTKTIGILYDWNIDDVIVVVLVLYDNVKEKTLDNVIDVKSMIFPSISSSIKDIYGISFLLYFIMSVRKSHLMSNQCKDLQSCKDKNCNKPSNLLLFPLHSFIKLEGNELLNA